MISRLVRLHHEGLPNPLYVGGQPDPIRLILLAFAIALLSAWIIDRLRQRHLSAAAIEKRHVRDSAERAVKA